MHFKNVQGIDGGQFLDQIEWKLCLQCRCEIHENPRSCSVSVSSAYIHIKSDTESNEEHCLNDETELESLR